MFLPIQLGQSGSGKSHTMDGNSEHPGIIPQTFDVLFKEMDDAVAAFGYVFSVSATFVKICNEQVYDLLSKESAEVQLAVLQSVESQDESLINRKVETASALLELWKESKMQLADSDEISSHHVTRITVTSQLEVWHKLGTIHLIDMIGSEMNDCSCIALRNHIVGLARESEFCTFDGTSLTSLIAPWCFGDSSRTALIVNLSPTYQEDYNETLKNLEFASKVTSLKSPCNASII